MGDKPTEEEFMKSELSDEDFEAYKEMEAEQSSSEEEQPSADSTEAEAKVDGEEKASESSLANEPKSVDLRALQASRAETREAKATAARLESRMDQLLDSMKKATDPKAEEESSPDPKADPLGAMAHDIKTVKERQDREYQQAVQQSQEEKAFREAVASEAKAVNDFEAAVAPFAKDDPTLVTAGDFVVKAFRENLADQGLAGKQLDRALLNNLSSQAQQGMNSKAGPGEYLRRLAMFHGWDGKAPEEVNADPAEVRAESTKKIEAEAATRRAHTSLSNVTGGVAPKEIDGKAIAAMSDSQFKKFMETPKGRQIYEESLGG